MRQLKDLGMGKTRLEKAIQYEAVCLVEDFKKHTDRPGPPPASITVAVLNVIWKLAAGIPPFISVCLFVYFMVILSTKKMKKEQSATFQIQLGFLFRIRGVGLKQRHL